MRLRRVSTRRTEREDLKELLLRAAMMGYSVGVWELESDLAGLTDLIDRHITLRTGMSLAQARSTLAHELGHAHYGHDCTTPMYERQARRYAARLLIDPALYAEKERINSDQHWLADEFTVTHRIIIDYEQFCLTRVSGMTYSHARLGTRQWAHRALTPA